MYKFLDTIEVSESVYLPSEALKINGEYIENLIPGYRTLHVSGREALSPEVDSYETGIRDGSMIKSKRYPARIITVTYQLIAASNTAFREAYNKLGSILDVADAELIFRDEQDKFFTGTPSAIGEVEPGRNAIIGEFEILCADPFKYSTEEYEVSAVNSEESDDSAFSGKVFQLYNNGTYKSFPIFTVNFYSESETSEDGTTSTALTGAGDCGFVAFFNDDGKVIQIGDPEELDGDDGYQESQTLVNQGFKSAWGIAQNYWLENVAMNLPYDEVQTGSLGLGASGNAEGEMYLCAIDYGVSGDRCGPSVTRTIPADDAGDVGASNFTLTYWQKIAASSGSQGRQEVGVSYAFLSGVKNNERVIVAGVRVAKYAIGSNAGKISFYVNNKMLDEEKIDLGYGNEYFGDKRACTITKTGNEVVFNVGGVQRAFLCSDEEFSELMATEITFTFMKYSSYEPIAYNGLYSAKFVKHNCDTFRNVPNKFGADDVLEADCSTGEIYLNDIEAPELGALGNDWEHFYLTPGVNQIGIAYSSWITDDYAPELKMRYREVFL